MIPTKTNIVLLVVACQTRSQSKLDRAPYKRLNIIQRFEFVKLNITELTSLFRRLFCFLPSCIYNTVTIFHW